MSMHRKGVIVLGSLCLLVAAYLYNSYRVAASATQDADQQQRVKVVPRSVSKQLKLTGVLMPKEQHTITAPLTGLVLEWQASLGQRVNAGDVLARIDPRDTEMQLRDAEAGLIKAQQRLTKLEYWDHSPEANRAKRDLDRSQRHLETLRRRAAQSKKLLDAGIIPASEYEGELQQIEDQRMDVASAQEALTSTLKQGDETEREIAALELKNAETKVNRLRDTIAAAVVKAPIGGIIVAAQATGDSSGRAGNRLNFNIGDNIKEGQPLFSIANTEDLIVQSHIDEIDVNSVELGQAATVISDAFPDVTMNGHLTKIAYQAKGSGSSSNQFPSFGIELALDTLPLEQRKQLRLGVTVQLAMEIYHRDKDIVVPFNAVESSDGDTFVRVMTSSGALEQRPVQLGTRLVDGVEVLSGLQPGDVVVVPRMPQRDED